MTRTEQEIYEQWRDDYALMYEPNYDEHLEADCKAAFVAGMKAARRAPAEPVISETQVLAITTAYEQGVGKGHQSHAHKETITNPYDKEWGCDSAWQMGYAEGREQAERTNLASTQPADAPMVPQGWKLVKLELLERIQESLGSFISDQGWSQSDMDTADALDGFLAAAPRPATAPAQEGWCDGCSPDNCCGCGPAAPALVQPEPSREVQHGH